MAEWKGNKGEWSEPYVFLKLLGDGRIYGADGQKNRLDNLFYDVRKVIRTDSGRPIHYVIIPESNTIEVRDGDTVLTTVAIPEIIEEYQCLFDAISTTNEHKNPRAEKFLKAIGCKKLKSPSAEKVDINIEIYEPQINMNVQQGFSIKSDLSSKSTLVNASGSTNVLYTLTNIDDALMDEVNEIFGSKEYRKIEKGMAILKAHDVVFSYDRCCSETLEDNLTMLDAHLPRILAEMLIVHYYERESVLNAVLDRLNEKNPLGYRNTDTMPFYAAKVKRLLSAYALGMESDTAWDGNESTKGGYIIVKDDGEILCYHICDRNDFEDYLLNNTKMETPSTTRHGYCTIYKVEDQYKIKLNLQIRFT